MGWVVNLSGMFKSVAWREKLCGHLHICTAVHKGGSPPKPHVLTHG